MNLEDYEEQLNKQQVQKDPLVEKTIQHMEQHRQQFAGQDGRVPTYDQLYPERTNWGNVERSPNGWQREYLAQFIPGEVRSLRQSGRTTRMVFQALIAASEGKRVYIVAHNNQMSRQIRRMVETASRSLNFAYDSLPHYVHNIVYLSDQNAQRGIINVEGNSVILYDNAIEDIRNGL